MSRNVPVLILAALMVHAAWPAAAGVMPPMGDLVFPDGATAPTDPTPPAIPAPGR